MGWEQAVAAAMESGLLQGAALAALASLAATLGVGILLGRRVAGQELAQAEGDLLQSQEKLSAARRKVALMEKTVDDLERGIGKRAAHIDRIRDALDSDAFRRPLTEPSPFARKASDIPIIAVGNLKGGVGKTTLAANLGAFLADRRHARLDRNKPVLFIDLDFQGSLSSILISSGVFSGDGDASAKYEVNKNALMAMFDPDLAPSLVANAQRELRREHLEGSAFYDCDLKAAEREDLMMFEWVFGEPPGADCRLHLANYLASPFVQEKFGAVVIDMPPRNSIFAYNALCAANNLVIPTRDDRLSTTAVRRFVGFLEAGRERLWPALNIVGVVGMNTDPHHTRQEQIEKTLIALAKDGNRVWRANQPPILYLGSVPFMPSIANAAAVDFAYFNDAEKILSRTANDFFSAVGSNALTRLRI
ncbi:MAG: ParA family protein [Pseudomonadota bacterium]